jgi:hypothetical protein
VLLLEWDFLEFGSPRETGGMKMGKKIKIAFSDFWPEFSYDDNYFIDTLSRYYDIEIVKEIGEAEYLFFSAFGNEHLKYDCVKFFYTGENLVPDFNLCDYAIGYEHMQYGDRYIRMPIYVTGYRWDFERMLEIRGKIDGREKFCSFVASNGKMADPTRKAIFEKLSEYKKVDSGGRYLNNIGQPDGVKDKRAFQEQYKFSMAVENSSHKGYCTEKIVQAFAAGTIPIYWGDTDVGIYFNEKAFINCHRYESLDDMLKAVKEIDNDDEKYQTMLKEPVITDENQMLEAYDRSFEIWIRNIMDQPLEKAYRRSLYGWSLRYKKRIVRETYLESKFLYMGKFVHNIKK